MDGLVPVDAWFGIGRGHVVCQDYALAAPALGVVADGCSGSPATDFGARFLALALALEGAIDPALERARRAIRALDLPLEALDATLLSLRTTAAGAVAEVAGDGVVAARRRDGRIEAWEVRYPSGAPGYPGYRLDLHRLAAWRAETGARREVVWRLDDREEVRPAPGIEPIRFGFPAARYSLVAVLSDGATAVQRLRADDTTRTAETVPLMEVLGRLLQVRAPAGEFVRRRCQRFVGRECPAREWHLGDDLSMAAMILQEKGEPR